MAPIPIADGNQTHDRIASHVASFGPMAAGLASNRQTRTHHQQTPRETSLPHQIQTSLLDRIFTFLGTAVFVLLFPVALLVALVVMLLAPIVEIVFETGADVWRYWAAELRESRRLRTPLEERDGRPAKHLGMFGSMGRDARAKLPHNQRLRAEAPAIIRDALARGLVVEAPYGYGYQERETRYIEWISDDDERVIAYREGEYGQDTFRLYHFCCQRKECTPEETFIAMERNQTNSSGENDD